MIEPIQFLRKGVTVFTSALYQTTSTLIETPEAVFLVDPNWLPFEIYRIREYVYSVIKKRKLYLVFTHSDYDHIIGYGAFPGASVIASKAFADKSDKDRDIRDIQEFDRAHYIVRDYEISYPVPDIIISADGKALHFSGTVLTFYLAPGHTKEGMYILVDPVGVWIAGDYLSDMEFPFVEDGISAYRRTMAKTGRVLRLHDVRYMIPGHGTVAKSREQIVERRDHAIEYLDDLESATHNGITFPESKYQVRYPFWDSLQENHQKNMQLHVRKNDQTGD